MSRRNGSGTRLKIGWLYSSRMNIYGDRGNVIVLKQRASWRGIATDVVELGIGDGIPSDIDIFFFGGGQDQEQVAVSEELSGHKGGSLVAALENGASLLAVCGGYQLLGHVYRPHDAEPLPGIGFFDLETVAGDRRFIGNVVVDSQWGELVGFENHSGLTFLGPNARPMGNVRIGHGNNGRDGTEGAIRHNAVGCYLHGSLLPKNPALADWLLQNGLERQGQSVDLEPLPDTLENVAHDAAIRRAIGKRRNAVVDSAREKISTRIRRWPILVRP
jgi:lipid II isoglutaminyl synthase (glutamine-hydrolysing)